MPSAVRWGVRVSGTRGRSLSLGRFLARSRWTLDCFSSRSSVGDSESLASGYSHRHGTGARTVSGVGVGVAAARVFAGNNDLVVPGFKSKKSRVRSAGRVLFACRLRTPVPYP